MRNGSARLKFNRADWSVVAPHFLDTTVLLAENARDLQRAIDELNFVFEKEN